MYDYSMNKISLENAFDPYFFRENTFSLNGLWDFDVTHGEKPNYKKKILVPFAPETELSGINKTIKPNHTMFYRLKIDEETGFEDLEARIVFEAVDQICDVYWNGTFTTHHEGGYWPFSIVVPHLRKGDVLELIIKDDTNSDVFARGKQTLNPGNIWYKATSGIWGNVYVEYLPNGFRFDKIDITANYDRRRLIIDLGHNVSGAKIEVTTPRGEVLKGKTDDYGEALINLADHFYPWSDQEPNLYTVIAKKDDDEIHSVFGVRKIEKIVKNNKNLIALNEKPIYLCAVLDQGYYSPQSGMTPLRQSDLFDELSLIKQYGFNAIRKHIKIESPRWYYECDRLGILVMQDMVNSGGKVPFIRLALAPFINLKLDDTDYKSMKRESEQSRKQFETDVTRTVRLLDKHPSIVLWTLFNEGWGQFDSVRLTEDLRLIDDSRLIDSTSGWFDTKSGDFDSHHIYFRRPSLKNKGDRILSLSEFGGFSHSINGHSPLGKSFGYSKYRDTDALLKAYKNCLLGDLIPLIHKEGLSVSVLTQWSDVESETNGLITYDRLVEKVKPEEMKKLNDALLKEFNETWG